jgi:hypothetical protein
LKRAKELSLQLLNKLLSSFPFAQVTTSVDESAKGGTGDDSSKVVLAHNKKHLY